MWNHSNENKAADAIVHFEDITKTDEVMKRLATLKSLHIKYETMDNPCKIRLKSININ